jgi:hypothetical protein
VPAWRLFAAWLGAEVGEMDDDLAEHVDAVFADFARYGARQVMPVLSQAQLARTIELLGDTEKAATQYAYLLPYAGRVGALTPLLSTDHALGVLARMLGHGEDARRHFTDGIAFADRLGAPLVRSICEAELSA